MKPKFFRALGVVGTILCLAVFIHTPSFPTPDKLLVFMIFVGMIFGQALEVTKRFVPFIGILLVYESFRGLADGLNTRVEYLWMPHVDRLLFGGTLPTQALQNWLWQGHVSWYDYVFYTPYLLHFVLPLSLAVYVWKFHVSKYWHVVTTYVVTSFSAFLVFLAFPAAPPWMASDLGYIEHIRRVSSDVWWTLGIHDFPSFYNDISPNPVAAVPSLHAAYATIFALYVTTLSKSKWRFLAWIYPLLIYVGTIYTGEHYAIDEILGALLGAAVFFATPIIVQKIKKLSSKIRRSGK